MQHFHFVPASQTLVPNEVLAIFRRVSVIAGMSVVVRTGLNLPIAFRMEIYRSAKRVLKGEAFDKIWTNIVVMTCCPFGKRIRKPRQPLIRHKFIWTICNRVSRSSVIARHLVRRYQISGTLFFHSTELRTFLHVFFVPKKETRNQCTHTNRTWEIPM